MTKLYTIVELLLRLRQYSALPLLIWSLIVIGLSSVPGNQYPKVDFPAADKLVHLSLYLCGGLCAALCFFNTAHPRKYAIIFGALFGLSDEAHQLLVPFRSFSLLDWTADIIGITIGVLMFQIYMQKFHLPWKMRSEFAVINSERLETI